MWKRLKIFEAIVSGNFLFSLFLYIVNEDYLEYAIPKDIAGYIFWLSLGLYLGFRLCKYEFKRLWIKSKGNELEERV